MEIAPRDPCAANATVTSSCLPSSLPSLALSFLLLLPSFTPLFPHPSPFQISSYMKLYKHFFLNQSPDGVTKWRPDERENNSTKVSRFQNYQKFSVPGPCVSACLMPTSLIAGRILCWNRAHADGSVLLIS